MLRFEYSYDIEPNQAQEALVKEDTLLFDIETTGLSAKSSHIYCIGYAYRQDKKLQLIQLFAENKEQEAEVLTSFLDTAASFHTLLSYNGRAFDVRYLQEKCASYQLDPAALDLPHIDLYRLYLPYKKLLGAKNMKQKSLELLLDTGREDLYTGGELIQIYRDYTQHPEDEKKDVLLLHNREDVYGLFLLTKFHALPALFSEFSYTISQIELEEGERRTLAFYLNLKEELPISLSYYTEGLFLYARKNAGIIKVPLTHGKMRFYYDNYQEYYYFPEEDMAIHKMVAKFAASTHREKASAKTAYTWQEGNFLPLYDLLNTEELKLFYKDTAKKEPYILYDDSSFKGFTMAYCEMLLRHITSLK